MIQTTHVRWQSPHIHLDVVRSPCGWAPNVSDRFYARYSRLRPPPRSLGASEVQRPPVPLPAVSLGPGPPGAAALPNVSELDLATVLKHVHASSCPLQAHARVVMKGSGRQLGLDCSWQLRVSGAGPFREDVTAPEMSFACGFHDGTAWEVDSTGCSHRLELDDFEALLLATWLRTGIWTLPALLSQLEVHLTHAPPTPDSSDRIRLDVRLRGSKVHASVDIDPSTWQPAAVHVHMCFGTETWQLLDWQRWGPSAVPFPARTLHSSLSAGQQELALQEVEVPEPDHMAHFSMPTAPLLPLDARFLPGVAAAVPAWRTSSGHLLVRPCINGRQLDGYMILDTGASGFVIEPAAANALGMAAFGEVHVAGMSDTTPTRFRRAHTFRLGPLEMDAPTMMELRCNGLVTGAPGPVVGIVGYEVFRRAVVDIPAQSAAVSAAEGGIVNAAAAFSMASWMRPRSNPKEHTIYLHHPAHCHCDVDEAAWVPVVMLSTLPHLRVEMHAAAADGSTICHPTLLMLDTGAGGMDTLINSRAATALGFLDSAGKVSGKVNETAIKGVGGDAAGRVKMYSERLPLLALGPELQFQGVRCLWAGAKGAAGGHELSHHSAGLLAGDLLAECRLVVDVPRRRVAIES